MRLNRQPKCLHTLIVASFITISVLSTSCGRAQIRETFTIGVVTNVSTHDLTIEGFKAGMAELGHIEGENVTYIYNGLTEPNPQAIDAEIESLLTQDVDMLFTVGIPVTLAAKKGVTGTDIPVVFGPVVNPVEERIVESIRDPGGNLTGVQVSGNDIPKALEWLVTREKYYAKQ